MHLTTEQKRALADFQRRHGRTWKAKLRDAWMTGNYPSSEDDTATLQCLRNSSEFGPRGLIQIGRYHLQFNACTIVRTFVRQHFTMKFNSDDPPTPAGPDTIHTEPCNIPLFAEPERTTGVCASCRKGWEVEANKFATDAERERAMASVAKVINA